MAMWLIKALLLLSTFTYSLTLPDYCSVCGVVRVQPRIFNGRPSTYSPWSVYLETLDGNSIYLCTGVLIDFNHILTAAHCFLPVQQLSPIGKAEQLSVFAGDIIKMGREAIRLPLKSVHLHPTFKYTAPDVNSYDDLAIIKLNKSIEVTDYIRPACLANIKPVENDSVLIQGYGYKDLSHNSNRLLEANMRIESEEKCKRVYGKMFTPDHLCSINGTAGMGSACQGDSGGGLFLMKKGRQYVVGTTSFGGHCDGFPNQAVVFTRISSYIPWIREITGNKFECAPKKKKS